MGSCLRKPTSSVSVENNDNTMSSTRQSSNMNRSNMNRSNQSIQCPSKYACFLDVYHLVAQIQNR